MKLLDDVAGQIQLEAGARRAGIDFRRFVDGPVVRYEFEVDVTGTLDTVGVEVKFGPRGSDRPAIRVDGPECLRHRWDDGTICVWDPGDPVERRWVLGDGFEALRNHIQLHAFCEEECRQGGKWLKPESDNPHPRKKSCASCHGKGK